MKAALLLSPLPLVFPKLPALAAAPSLYLIPTLTFPSLKHRPSRFPTPRPDFRVRSDDGDPDGGGPDDYDMDDEEVEEVDNKKDYDVEYEPLAAAAAASVSADEDDIAMVHSKSFVSTQGWDSETVVDYRINEEEFHKISLLDCDFFIRKPPDPDNDVYDFREMYVTPPDTDVYSIPKVLAPMPHKYIRCAKSDYGCYNVTEPPIDAPRDPLYKSEREISKVFLTKHYRNRRLGDPEFVLDFEEIYVIDSKTKSITRAKVLDLKMKKTIGSGHDKDGLYYLDCDPSPVHSPFTALCTSISPLQWHRRLGHSSLPRLKLIVPNLYHVSRLDCEACQFGKHHRNTFSSRSNSRESESFAVIHTDVWGPSRVKSINGFFYFVLFIDDFSRLTWLF